MKIPDIRYIVTGAVVFLVVMTFPFWYNIGKAASAPEVSLDTPRIRQMAEPQCVEPASYMRANHMRLLEEWRERVVRQGERIYVAGDGKEYLMSLQNTCLDCHSNYDEFCARCHDYAGVAPDCWTCHLDFPRESK
ncbi:sulfate reduction electron transfer complex DsrMKJOP subunit DsrJ [Thermanaeromonas sp. C210]|uniref:sulfate reduction electron transfer complex DsrMKJOP subunit DsrJ n=1 Tax=Thermanaeromonas sp. C210 TaxID=2731925 RepID=UPI00155B69E2|nr:sulfate reduction electron transfer complex DsrMKJOP subunit DsrJ [Thermanaeromonas sp. C210]GFN23222.1 cytochrome c [Thermanaeromonas sp. C210]